MSDKSKRWAAHRATELLADEKLLILDTETTGLRDGEIIELTIIDVKGMILFNSYIKPARSIPPDATRIHGITYEMLAGEPSWGELLPTITDLVNARQIVTYNADYDSRMFYQSTAYDNPNLYIDWHELATWRCAMETYASFHGDWNPRKGSFTWQGLSPACAQLGIVEPDVRAHSALGDCLRTLEVLRAMARYLEQGSVS